MKLAFKFNSGRSLFNAEQISFFLCAVLLVFLSACVPPGPTADTNPPGGAYSSPIYVSFTIPASQWDQIYYTLDGQEPVEGCLEWLGQAFEVAETLELKYVLVKNGVASATRSVFYEIAGTGGGNEGAAGNEALLLDWVDFEVETRQIFMDKFFGGCEPVRRCGSINLNDLKLWTLCEGTDMSDPSNTTAAACEAEGKGWLSWNVIQEGLGGSSIFTYSNFTHTTTSGCTLTAEAGEIVGHFDANATGFTTTGEGASVVLSGCRNGILDDAVKLTLGAKTGGTYTVACTDADCSGSPEVFLVSAGPTFNLYSPPSVEPSCAAPTYLIQSLYSDVGYPHRCLTASTSGTGVYLSLCTNYENQQWVLTPNNNTTEATNDYQLKSVSRNKCLSTLTTDLLQFYTPILSDCDEFQSDNKQNMRINGGGSILRLSPDVQYNDYSYRCISANLVTGYNDLVSWFNCGGATTNFSFYENGQFPSVGLADLPQ